MRGAACAHFIGKRIPKSSPRQNRPARLPIPHHEPDVREVLLAIAIPLICVADVDLVSGPEPPRPFPQSFDPATVMEQTIEDIKVGHKLRDAFPMLRSLQRSNWARSALSGAALNHQWS